MNELEDTADLPRPSFDCRDEEGCEGLIKGALTASQAAIEFSKITGGAYVLVKGYGVFEVERSTSYRAKRLEERCGS
ncbi:MAG: hypothetical protein AAF627_10390 [Myxococcota bacterium]